MYIALSKNYKKYEENGEMYFQMLAIIVKLFSVTFFVGT